MKRSSKRWMGFAIVLLLLALAAACGNTAEEVSGMRTVSTVNGDVDIPVEPKRIVALYYHHILLAMDSNVVGANLTWWGGSPFLQSQEAGLVDVGGPSSLEAVAALEPDLILMNSNNAEDYEQFAKIAPSVLIPYEASRTAYDDARLVGEILGKPDASAQLQADFEAKAAEARGKLADIAPPGTKAAIIRIEGNGAQFSIFGSNYGRGGWPIYEGLQFVKPDRIAQELEAANAEIVQQLAIELLPDYVADADYIFWSNEGEGTDLISETAWWNTIPAVKNGKLIELDSAQFFYFDPISIEAQLDLIADLLL